jgi:hypothetical protein
MKLIFLNVWSLEIAVQLSQIFTDEVRGCGGIEETPGYNVMIGKAAHAELSYVVPP